MSEQIIPDQDVEAMLEKGRFNPRYKYYLVLPSEWDECQAMLKQYREVAAWVADKLGRLADLEPHAWDRSTLRELQHALTDNPLLP